jgi:hypothetical protein
LDFAGEKIYLITLNAEQEALADGYIDADTKEVKLLQRKKGHYEKPQFFTAENTLYAGEIVKVQYNEDTKKFEAVEKFPATTSVSPDEIEIVEAQVIADIFPEHFSLAQVTPSFAEKFNKSAEMQGKAYKFPYNSGSGYKKSVGYLWKNPNDYIELVVTMKPRKSTMLSNVTNQIADKKETLKAIEKLKGKPSLAKVQVKLD